MKFTNLEIKVLISSLESYKFVLSKFSKNRNLPVNKIGIVKNDMIVINNLIKKFKEM